MKTRAPPRIALHRTTRPSSTGPGFQSKNPGPAQDGFTPHRKAILSGACPSDRGPGFLETRAPPRIVLHPATRPSSTPTKWVVCTCTFSVFHYTVFICFILCLCVVFGLCVWRCTPNDIIQTNNIKKNRRNHATKNISWKRCNCNTQ